MTAGNKIEALRKSKGMSQEDLASKLFVSRQTISQWENGQTNPTVENYLRLCDVFSVTMNDFFDSMPQSEGISENEYSELYKWRYTEAELSEVSDIIIKPLKKRLVVSAVLIALAFVLCVLSQIAIACGAVAFCAVLIGFRWGTVLRQYSKTTKERIEIIKEREYHFGVTSNMLAVTVFDKDGGVVSFDKIYQSSVDKIVNTDKYCIITYKLRNYIIKKDELSQNSLIATIGQFAQ